MALMILKENEYKKLEYEITKLRELIEKLYILSDKKQKEEIEEYMKKYSNWI